MKTFKIQPRSAVDQASSHLEVLQALKVKTPNKQTLKTQNTQNSVLSKTHIVSRSKSPPCIDTPKGSRQKNKSLVENPHTHTIYNLRIASSECSALLDNEIFRIKAEAEVQKREVLTHFEELCQRLARKLNYLQNYIEQQVSYVVTRLAEQKNRLDQSILNLDQFMDSSSQSASLNDVHALQKSLSLNLQDLPNFIPLPTVVDPEEMLSTFGSLVEGHVCKKEIKIDLECFSHYNQKILQRNEMVRQPSSSILKANINALNTCPKDEAHDSNKSRLEVKIAQMLEVGRTKQKSYDAVASKIKGSSQGIIIGQEKAKASLRESQACSSEQRTPLLSKVYQSKGVIVPKQEGKNLIFNQPTYKAENISSNCYDSRNEEISDSSDLKMSDQLKLPSSNLQFSVDLQCHENMEVILPRPITHIEEVEGEED
jgi:hypothetical protein